MAFDRVVERAPAKKKTLSHSQFYFTTSLRGHGFYIACYKIPSRATQSNLVYVHVHHNPVVHADSVCKSLRQKVFFSHQWPELERGKIIYFTTKMDTNIDSSTQGHNEDDFPMFSVGLEFLNGGTKEKNCAKGELALRPSCFASLTAWVLMYISTNNVIKQLVYAFGCALLSNGSFGNFYASFVLSKIPSCTITR